MSLIRAQRKIKGDFAPALPTSGSHCEEATPLSASPYYQSYFTSSIFKKNGILVQKNNTGSIDLSTSDVKAQIISQSLTISQPPFTLKTNLTLFRRHSIFSMLPVPNPDTDGEADKQEKAKAPWS